MNSQRHYTFLDRLCLSLDQVVRTLNHQAKTTGHPNPAKDIEESVLNDKQRERSAALMRINHAGEVCAQALYHGQGVISRDVDVQEKMQRAAIEEGDHLSWCHERLEELGSHTSYLNPLWYAGSFCIGVVAGIMGDKWSLGFVAETERQVIQHLQGHLHLLPRQDQRSYHIIKKMEEDERHHRDDAMACGAKELPDILKKSMAMTSKIMVKTAYWI